MSKKVEDTVSKERVRILLKGRTQQGAVMPTPQDKWEWFGTPGHFCSPQRCQFHMTTRVGKYLISSVGEYFSNGIPLGGWEWKDLEEVGLGRKYETMVFKFKGICRDKECDCRRPNIYPSEIDMLPANKRGDAQKNHMKLCRKYAAL